MANHKSAKKRAKQDIKKNALNTALKSKTKSAVKNLNSALEKKDAEKSTSLFKIAQKELAKLGQKHIIHRNSADRKISRLAKLVNSLNS